MQRADVWCARSMGVTGTGGRLFWSRRDADNMTMRSRSLIADVKWVCGLVGMLMVIRSLGLPNEADRLRVDPRASVRSDSRSLSTQKDRYGGFRLFRVEPSQKDLAGLSAIQIVSNTEVELTIKDSLGNTTGYDSVTDSILEQCSKVSYTKDLPSLPPEDDDTLVYTGWRLPGATTTLYFLGVTRVIYQILLTSEDSTGFDVDVELIPNGGMHRLVSSVSGPLLPGHSRQIWISLVDDQSPAAIILNLGDVDLTGAVDIGDLDNLVSYLVNETPVPQPVPAAGDVNCDGLVDIGDVIYLVDYLFNSGPPPQCAY